MAGTATHLHTVPPVVPVRPACPVREADPVAPAAVRRRGNHPAGRALVGPGGASTTASSAGAPVATVVALRPRASEVASLDGRARSAGAVPTRPSRAARGPVREAPAPLRLTRRGRRVVAGLGVGVVVGLFSVVGAAGAALLGADSGPALELAGRSSVVVHSGDTLWSIAQSVAPDTDPREVVDALQEVNGLTDAALVPGQVLLLP